MCNGTSSRTSQGGTIVVLQSKSSSPRPQPRRELSLRLSADAVSGQTIATFNGLEGPLGSHFVIHRDGDLVTGGGLTETTVLHRFAVPHVAHTGSAFSLDQSLDLGVGGDGVIGRRVSFVNQQTVLGEGILGWN